MRNIIKVAFLSSIITAAMVYVILEWKPLRSEESRPPEVSWASPSTTPTEPVSSPAAALSEDEKNNIDIYQKYNPGVVNITTTTLTRDFFFQVVPQSGSGSGAILDNQGHIVTNYHVVEGARRLEVTLADKSKHPAEIVGIDSANDLAVIKINARRPLTTIPLGTSKDLQVGQKVLAIGNPFALQGTLTTGIISSLGRSIEAPNGRIIENIIQTDAAINPGNSGGPLLNSSGQLIGINTAILGSSGSIGIGFAVPADTVRRITNDLITLGYVRRPYLGISQEAISLREYPWIADALRINSDNSGLMVVQVSRNSPAERAGIRQATEQVIIGNYRVPVGGDVILAINDKAVTDWQQLALEIDRYKPGDRVKVTILRNNQRRDIEVVLQEAPRG